jgi:hypothetical protein
LKCELPCKPASRKDRRVRALRYSGEPRVESQPHPRQEWSGQKEFAASAAPSNRTTHGIHLSSRQIHGSICGAVVLHLNFLESDNGWIINPFIKHRTSPGLEDAANLSSRNDRIDMTQNAGDESVIYPAGTYRTQGTVFEHVDIQKTGI